MRSLLLRSAVSGILVPGILGLLSFLAGAWLVRSLVPAAEGGGRLNEKLEYFDEHGGEYDALIIGPSQAHRGLDPRVLDARLARAGFPATTFSLSGGGMRTFEQDYVLRRVLAAKQERLRRIYLVAGPVGATIPEFHEYDEVPNLRSARGVQWHTTAVTRSVLSAVWTVPIPFAQRLTLTRAHVELWARHMTALGRGAVILERLLEGPDARAQRGRVFKSLRRTGGFTSLDEVTGEERSKDLADSPARAFVPSTERVREENALPVALDAVPVDQYRRQLALASARGVELVYVTLPSEHGAPELVHLHRAGVVPELLHLDDPERFPDLFRVQNRFDDDHANLRGAALQSRLFAQLEVERLRARSDTGGPPD